MRFREGRAWFLSVDFVDDNSNMMLIRLGDLVESLPYPLLRHTQRILCSYSIAWEWMRLPLTVAS